MKNNKKSFPEELNNAILAYRDDPHEGTYCRLLCCVLDGIAEDVSVPIPTDMDFERLSVRPRFQESRQGETGLVALTDPDGEKYPYFVSVKLRAVMRILLKEESCSGILLNPEEDNEVLIRKELLFSAIGAGLGMMEGHRDPEEQNAEDAQTLKIQRPVSEEVFEQIEEKISAFRDDPADFLVLDLIDDEDMLFLQACRCGDLCHLELAFDMSDFNLDHPLILGNELPLEQALRLLYRLLVDGESPDDIAEIQTGFHDMGFGED